MRRWSIPSGIVLVALALGCHREVEMTPLIERTIYPRTDRFYDVQALSKDRAIVVGYGGKIVQTTDRGMNWQVLPSGTDAALYGVRFVDENHGWISGQDGLILATTDGGKTWAKQESNATFEEGDGTVKRAYLFNIDATDPEHAWAVGDRSILVSTSDGGKTWRSRKVPVEGDLSGGESLAAADPIFYDVKFTDKQTGWIVGEFGKILHTTDGGETWKDQTKTQMEGSQFMDLLDLPSLFGLWIRDPQHAAAAGLEAHISATENGGEKWSYQKVDGGDVKLVDPLFAGVQFPDGSGWAVGAGGQVVRTDAASNTWTRANIGQEVATWLRGVSFSDPQYGWLVGGYGLIYHTEDGGKSWLPVQG
jgi:photosystem II stability/assembly factor-like uncharacterized protein